MQALGIIVGLSLGNFLWQATRKKPDWEQALKLSYFQAIAIGVTAYVYTG